MPEDILASKYLYVYILDALRQYHEWINYCLYTHQYQVRIPASLYALAERSSDNSFYLIAKEAIHGSSSVFAYYYLCIPEYSAFDEIADLRLFSFEKYHDIVLQSIQENWTTKTLPSLYSLLSTMNLRTAEK